MCVCVMAIVRCFCKQNDSVLGWTRGSGVLSPKTLHHLQQKLLLGTADFAEWQRCFCFGMVVDGCPEKEIGIEQAGVIQRSGILPESNSYTSWRKISGK